MAAPVHRTARRCSGLTLIELMTMLGIVAVLAALSLPSFGAQIARHRLKTAAETLAADVAEARFEAARRGSTLHLNYSQGPDWCWAVATASGCDCRSAQLCQLKAVRSADHPGVQLAQSRNAHFDPAGGAASGDGTAVLRSSHGNELRVWVSRLGHVRVCAPGAAALGYPAC
ncbi:MAG TPA: GspH/FimT family pseudopilin [Rubrivivax sp.]